jgi:hypothetical protein
LLGSRIALLGRIARSVSANLARTRWASLSFTAKPCEAESRHRGRSHLHNSEPIPA